MDVTRIALEAPSRWTVDLILPEQSFGGLPSEGGHTQ